MSAIRRCASFPTRSLLGMSAVIVIAIAVASQDQTVDFTPYFAGLPPLTVAVIVCLAGIVALRLLQQLVGFCVKSARTGWAGWVMAAGMAIPFMATVTLADLILEFPPDINVRLPTSLVFYPAMAFIAQITLHIVPFGVVLWTLTRMASTWPKERRVWLSIILAALPEAAFQFAGSHVHGGGLQAMSVFVAVQLFLFGLVELYLYRRLDFVCMYLFRLTYYGYWHIL